ncbi:MAG: hypothetical protein MnENMB40S_38780 [Rhizobiaceae bacterium MnEN-MB40S]|nr:MAG: hypothetical protein MnENMB40S_38780 [Rhizobiaceae bacterium MnEN-MB40S]
MKAVAETLGVSRSNLHERLKGTSKPRRSYHKAQDAALLPRIRALVAKRPTYGYRRMTAVLNRDLQAEGRDLVNHKRVYRIMKANDLLLERSGFERCERAHDSKSCLNFAAARLRHIAGTQWSTRKYINMSPLFADQNQGAVVP